MIILLTPKSSGGLIINCIFAPFVPPTIYFFCDSTVISTAHCIMPYSTTSYIFFWKATWSADCRTTPCSNIKILLLAIYFSIPHIFPATTFLRRFFRNPFPNSILHNFSIHWRLLLHISKKNIFKSLGAACHLSGGALQQTCCYKRNLVFH